MKDGTILMNLLVDFSADIDRLHPVAPPTSLPLNVYIVASNVLNVRCIHSVVGQNRVPLRANYNENSGKKSNFDSSAGEFKAS